MLKAAVFPSKYIQGDGVLANIADIIKQLGCKHPIIMWGKRTKKATEGIVLPALKEAGMEVYERMLPGECTPNAACDEIAAEVKEKGCDIVIGMGGGKALDLSKAVANHTGLKNIICPHRCLERRPHPRPAPCGTTRTAASNSFELWPQNPEVILVDTGVCITAPVHMFLAGVGDALATYVEAKACFATHDVACSAGGPPKQRWLWPSCATTCSLSTPRLPASPLKPAAVTPAFEKVVEATTLLSGIGWESCGVATAHVLGNSLADFPEAHHHMHGEKVAMGIVTQLMLDPDVDMDFTLKTVDFMVRVACRCASTTSTSASVSKSASTSGAWASATPATTWNTTISKSPPRSFDAMMMADKFGKARKAALGK